MALPPFLRGTVPNLILFGGKGGVGKTTCATATALALARERPESSYLLVSTDPAHSLLDSLAGDTPPGNLTAIELDAEERMAAFRQAHGQKLREIAARGTFLDDEDIRQFLDLSLPGLDELMAFLEISRFIERDTYATVVVDTAPWGHTLRLLEMPELIGRWLEALDALLAKHRYMKKVFSGAYRRDELDQFLLALKADVDRMTMILRNPRRCQFVAVTLAAALDASETAELASELERLKVPMTTIVVNRLYPIASCPVCTEGRGRQMHELGHLSRLGYVLWGVPLYQNETRGTRHLGAFWEGVTEVDARLAPPAVPPLPTPGINDPAPLPPPSTTLLIFAGKGGVGKTTLACATALRLARENPGKEVLLFSTDPAHSLSPCLGRAVRATPTRLVPGLSAMRIDAHAELEGLKRQYRKELERTLASLLPNLDLTFDREVMERILDLSPPGLDEIMGLAKAMELFARGTYQIFVLDSAPTGHLIRLLEMPELVDRWLKAFFGLFLKYKKVLRLPEVADRLVRLSRDIKRFRALLGDPARARLCAVTIPTEMACDETVDLLAACGRMGIHVPVLFVNQATPPGDCPLCGALRERESGVAGKLRAAYPEIHQTLVHRWGEPRGFDRLADLGRALYLEG